MSPAVVFGGQRLTADKTPVRTLSSKGTADGTGHAEVQGPRFQGRKSDARSLAFWTLDRGILDERRDGTRTLGRDQNRTGHERDGTRASAPVTWPAGSAVNHSEELRRRRDEWLPMRVQSVARRWKRDSSPTARMPRSCN